MMFFTLEHLANLLLGGAVLATIAVWIGVYLSIRGEGR